MIVRERFQLPVPFFVRDGFAAEPLETEIDRWSVLLYPPVQSENLRSSMQQAGAFSLMGLAPAKEPAPSNEVSINGKPAVPVDLFEVRFHLNIEPADLSSNLDAWLIDQGRSMVNKWLVTYRVYVGSTHIKPLPALGQSWRVDYLDDERNPLPSDKPPRPHGAVGAKVDAVASISPTFWGRAGDLAMKQQPARWDELLIDSFEVWPNIGASVVLAYTAIETRIDAAVDVLAAQCGVDGDLWEWLTDKRPYLTQPGTEEKAKFLLRLFTGHSLADEQAHWRTFSQLRKARNSFAHEGTARSLEGEALDSDATRELLVRVRPLLDWLEGQLPDKDRRPQLPDEPISIVVASKPIRAR